MNLTRLLLLLLLPLSLAACGERHSTSAPAAAAHDEAEHKEGEAHEPGETHTDEHEHGEEESGHVELTAEQIKQAGIGLAQVGPAEIRESLPLYGVIAPNAERVREVTARYPGFIRSVDKRIGDSVGQGERLATIESNESLETYSLLAPLAGVITARDANQGEQTGDKALFTVADLTSVWVELSLFPRDIPKVRVDQPVRVRSADSGLTAEGKVIYVAPFGSSANQTLKARVLLDNRDRQWPPGLYVTAEVTLAKTQVPLAVRKEALQTLEGQTVVFVQSDAGFAPQPVRTGRSDGEFMEVLDGLSPGQTYATANSFILKAELGKGEAEHEH